MGWRRHVAVAKGVDYLEAPRGAREAGVEVGQVVVTLYELKKSLPLAERKRVDSFVNERVPREHVLAEAGKLLRELKRSTRAVAVNADTLTGRHRLRRVPRLNLRLCLSRVGGFSVLVVDLLLTGRGLRSSLW